MTKVNLETIKPIAENVYKLKSEMTYSLLTGKYRDYKRASKSLAQIATQDFELVKNTPGMRIQISNPITTNAFFKTALVYLKVAKVTLLNKLRIKTSEEKLFAEKLKEEAIRDSFRKSVREQIKSNIRYDIDKKIQPQIDTMAEEKTDYLMRLIPKDIMRALEDDVIAHNGEISDSTRNAAYKEINGLLLDSQKTGLNTKFFNKSFLKSLNIPTK